MAINKGEGVSVVSLGSSLDKRQVSLWRNVERRIFEDDPYYVPAFSISSKGEDTEFFVLYDGADAIGRAAISINRQWIDEKGENLGFIDGFVIDPEYQEQAGMLIEHCLSLLKERGFEGAVVRSNKFPALASQKLGRDVPPFCLPCNPPSYIDLFEGKGFVRYKEWANFRFKLPAKVPEVSIVRGKKCVTSLQVKTQSLNMRSRRHINGYIDLKKRILEDHFGYAPQTFMDEVDSLPKHIFFVMLCLIAKFKIYVLENRSGEIIGFLSFCPNYNVAARPLLKSSGVFSSLLAIPKFILSLRRTKRVEIEAIGLTKEMRGKGFINLMDHGVKVMVNAGYKELDTGPIPMENTVVVKMVHYIQKKYGFDVEHMRYYTLLHRF